MFLFNGRRILLGVTLIFIVRDCTGDGFDPLPSGVRTAISSNHLSESTPEVFSEYHALLPNFRGDYGVKSKFVEAATKEPVYKGSDTFILPLYIPKGAIPFPIHERPTRSGSANGQPNMRILRGPNPSVRNVGKEHLNRPSLPRRIGSPSRRPYIPRPQNPTPPPSFIRTWIRQRGRAPSSGISPGLGQNGKAPPVRKGLPTASASEGRISVSKPDIPKDSRKKVNITPIRRPSLRISSPSKLNSTSESSSIDNVDENFESERIATKRVQIYSTSTTSVPQSESSSPSATEKPSGSKNKSLDDQSNKRTKLLVPLNPKERKQIKQETTDLVQSTTSKDATRILNTPATVTRLRLPGVSVDSDSLKQGIKEEREQPSVQIPSTITPKSFSVETTTETTVTTSTTTTTIPSSIFPLFSSHSGNKETPSSTAPPKDPSDQLKSAAWLLRRRAALRKRNRTPYLVQKTETEKHDHGEKKKDHELDPIVQEWKPNTTRVKAPGSIIDRVLNSAASQVNSTTSSSVEKIPQNNKSEIVIPPERKRKYQTTTPQTLRKRINKNRPTFAPNGERKTPKLSSTLQRVPIRVQNPVVSNSRTPTKSVTKSNKENGSTVPKEQLEDRNETQKPLEKEEDSISTNSITTSTPKLPRLDLTRPAPKPKIITPIRKPLLESFRPAGIPIKNTPSTLRSQDPSSTPRLRSAQDIVLEKLSKLMTDATNKSKSIDDIAKELETLNRELSQLGIHIIDAEFGGHKLKLTHHGIDPRTRQRNRSNSTKPLRKPDFDLGYHPFRGTRPVTFIPYTHELSDRDDIHMSSIKSKNQEEVPHLPTKLPEDHRLKETSTTPISIATNSSVNTEKERESISATTTLSPSDVTKTRTTVVPLGIRRDDTPTSYLDWKTRMADNEQPNDDDIEPITTMPPSRALVPEPTIDGVILNHPRPISTPAIVEEIITLPPAVEEVHRPREGYEVDENLVGLREVNDQHASYGSANKNTEVQLDKIDAAFEDESYVYLFGLLGIVPFSVLLFLLYRQRRKRQEKALPESEEGTDGFTPPTTTHVRPSVHTGTLDAVPPYLGDTLGDDSPWEFPRSKLRLTSIIGEGNFGMVWKAEVRNLCDWDEDGDGPTVLVAVKGVKEGAGSKEKNDLLRELSIMQLLGQHNNIVTLLGCCTTSEPHFLVMEYIMFGKLLTFLRDHRSRNDYYNLSSDSEQGLTSKDLTKFACQIATGCEYLQSRGVIHRDLAARNILVDHNKVCKIADFGLARSVKDQDTDIYEQKSRGPLPIRWMAPESLYMNIFTHKSDVWSFGILCWEIVTLGSTPYPGVSAREVMRRVREGFRLERPEHCHTEFYQTITRCWTQDRYKRPSFTEVKDQIKHLLDTSNRWIDLENFQESTYYSMHENNDEKL